MFGVRGGNPCLALRGPWSGAPAAVQFAPGPAFNGGVLAWGAPTRLGEAAFTRPIGTKTGCIARFDKSCVVNFFHYSFSPFTGLDVRWF